MTRFVAGLAVGMILTGTVAWSGDFFHEQARQSQEMLHQQQDNFYNQERNQALQERNRLEQQRQFNERFLNDPC